MHGDFLIMDALLVFGQGSRYAVPIKELDKGDEGTRELCDLDLTNPTTLPEGGQWMDRVKCKECAHL